MDSTRAATRASGGVAATRSELRDLARERLAGRLLVSVSNREPFVHSRGLDGTIQVRAAVGGLTVALNSAMEAVGGVWVAHGSGDADREMSNAEGRVRVPPDRPAYDLQRVWLTEEENDGYYNGFSNQALWPLCHNAYVKPVFREAHWHTYRHVNAKFAEAVKRVIGKREAIVFIQDYHFALLPAMLRQLCPNSVFLHFWHIPWPLPDILRICPWHADILEGALGNDVLGFHTPQYAGRFLDAAGELAGWKRSGASGLQLEGRLARAEAFPISIDFDGISAAAASPECDSAVERLRHRYGLAGKFVVLGLDRIDYTKGVLERLAGVDAPLERHPELRARVAYLHAGAPSRTRIPAYADLNSAMDAQVARLNARHGSSGVAPVISIKEHLAFSEVLALYRLCDVCVISSLEDGMNLVAKEFLAARNDERGHLLLSEFTGAAWELPGAECFNPFAVDHFADRLFSISQSRPAGQVDTMRRLRGHVRQHNVYGWLGSVLEAIPPGHSRT